MVEHNWQRPASPRRQGISLSESQKFKLTEYDLDPADELKIWANFIEAAALCTRLSRKRLQQVRPLGLIANLTPPLSKQQIGELSDYEAVELIARLRRSAEEMRTDTDLSR